MFSVVSLQIITNMALQACDDLYGTCHEKYTCYFCKGASANMVRLGNEADFVVIEKLLKCHDINKPEICNDNFDEVSIDTYILPVYANHLLYWCYAGGSKNGTWGVV